VLNVVATLVRHMTESNIRLFKGVWFYHHTTPKFLERHGSARSSGLRLNVSDLGCLPTRHFWENLDALAACSFCALHDAE
jgi:hypothetical protein